MFQFNKKCFFLNIILLIILIVIAIYVKDEFIRPFVGDVLVVFWVYLLLKSFLNVSSFELAHYTLLFAFAVEISQFYNLVNILGLEHIKLAKIIMGATFDWFDLLAYLVGWLVILIVEKIRADAYKSSNAISYP